MSKETVYHGRKDDVQSVHGLYEVIDRVRKLKPGWKVLVGSLCTITMLLECTNVVLLSQRGKKEHPSIMSQPYRESYLFETTLCEYGAHQFILGETTSDSWCAPIRDKY